MRSPNLNILLITILLSTLFANGTQIKLNSFDTGIKIDGFLSEDVWKDATRITDFYSFQPVEGQPAKEKTALLMGYDSDNLYMAIICFYDNPSTIRATVSKRDEIFEDDFIILYLDTFDDGKNAYQFAFNPYGIQADGIYVEHVGEDFKPDYIFESRGRIFQKGYIVEVQIPFSSLNFPDKYLMNWRLGVMRRTHYLSSDVTWPAFTRNSADWVGQFGKLSDIHSINTGKGLEVLPEFSSFKNDIRSDQTGELKDGPIKGEPGLNVKFGLTSGLNLDLTYNPDFSQIESDANKIDINRIRPLFYPEKRPFFLEGTDIFQTPIQAVYTRQLVNPLAGIKLSGRAGDYSIGFLSAFDEYQGSTDFFRQKASDTGYFPGFPDYDSFVNTLSKKYSDKKSINNILRIKRNVFNNSSIGLLATDREFEDSYNRVYGLDGRFTFTDKDVFTWQGLYAQTKEINSAKKMNDPAFYLNYWHATATWNVQLFYNDYSPDFRVENGFIERSDIISNGFREGGLQLWYNYQRQDQALQFFRPYLYITRINNHSGKVLENNLWPSALFKFDFNTELTLAYYYSNEYFGGVEFDKSNFSIDIMNAYLPWLQANFYYYLGDEIYYFGAPPFLGFVNFSTASLTFKPINNLSLDISYRYYRFTGGANGFNSGLSQEIPRLKINWQLSRYFSMRLIGEQIKDNYDDAALRYANSGQLDINFLLSYTPSPGTVIFLGYNDFHLQENSYNNGWLFKNYRRAQRGLFMKLSYLFRI